MISRKIIFSIFFLLFTAPYVFGQTEALKGVVNSLAFYKQQKDLKFLAKAKKSVDSLIVTRSDSTNLEKNVYKAIVYASIVYIDSLNKLNQPANFFDHTTALINQLSKREKIYKYQPEMDYAKRCLANACIRRGFEQIKNADYNNALHAFKTAQTYAPSYRKINAYIAFANSKLGSIQEAAKYYNTLLSTDTIKSEYIENAVTTYKAIGDTAKALQILQKGRRLLPNDKTFIVEEANIYNNKRDYKSLALLLPQLLDDNTNNADIAFIAANCYDHLNQYDKAESLYLHTIDLNGTWYDPVFNLGLLYLKTSTMDKDKADKDLKRAILWLEKASEMSPYDSKCLQLLKIAYNKQGDQEQLDRVNNKLKQLIN